MCASHNSSIFHDVAVFVACITTTVLLNSLKSNIHFVSASATNLSMEKHIQKVVLLSMSEATSIAGVLQGEYNAEDTFAEVALIVAREVIKTHILSNSKDCFAVVLYGTVRRKLSDLPIFFQDKVSVPVSKRAVQRRHTWLSAVCLQRESKNMLNFPYVTVLQDLAEPSAERIKALNGLLGACSGAYLH